MYLNQNADAVALSGRQHEAANSSIVAGDGGQPPNSDLGSK
jgi:hypothetical protein